MAICALTGRLCLIGQVRFTDSRHVGNAMRDLPPNSTVPWQVRISLLAHGICER